MARVPARYTGPSTIISKINGRVYDAQGKVVPAGKRLNPGDVIQFGDQEVYGFTLKFDPRGNDRPLNLGLGKAVLPEHDKLNEDELYAVGYEFHQPRQDVEELESLDAYLARLQAEKESREAEEKQKAEAAAKPAKKE